VDLDQLDAEKTGPFAVLVDGERRVVPAASALPWKSVVACATSPHYFALLAWPPDVRLKAWQIEAAQKAWRIHNGLPDPAQIRRLTYMIERYHDGIEYDLRTKAGVHLGELWRSRRWRELLVYMDHLPTDSHKNRLMVNDEEYMSAVLSQESQGDNRPSMAEWSQTNAMLAKLIDAVNRNTAVTHAVSQGTKGKLDFPPEPRPGNAVDKIKYRKEKEAHEVMTSMLLPRRD